MGDARKPRGPPRAQNTANRAPSARTAARAEVGTSIQANEVVVAAVGGGATEVRVIGEKNENLGLLPAQEAVLAAKAKGLDLLLVNGKASPPICKIGSVQALIKAQRAKAKAAAEAERARKVKEIRLTARTDDHDLSVKAGRVVDFLREGHPVKVSVSFTLAAWGSEEPARREVMAKLCRAVAEAGAGFPEITSIQGASSVLSAQFQPVGTPKPAAEWEKVLRLFASPIRPASQQGEEKKASEEGLQGTVKAALDGQVSKATAAAVLPPDEILRRYARRALAPKVVAGVKAGGEAVADEEEDDRADSRPRGGPRGRRGGRRGSDGGDEGGGGGDEEELFDRGEKLIDLKVAGRRKGKAAHKR